MESEYFGIGEKLGPVTQALAQGLLEQYAAWVSTVCLYRYYTTGPQIPLYPGTALLL